MVSRVLLRLAKLRRARWPKSLILMYHRIDDPVMDPWGVCVTPGIFAAQMQVLAEMKVACPLSEIQAGSGRVAVTFDDGYADNLYTALPILKQHNVPATFFVVAGTVGKPAFWWDELERVFFSHPRLPLNLFL